MTPTQGRASSARLADARLRQGQDTGKQRARSESWPVTRGRRVASRRAAVGWQAGVVCRSVGRACGGSSCVRGWRAGAGRTGDGSRARRRGGDQALGCARGGAKEAIARRGEQGVDNKSIAMRGGAAGVGRARSYVQAISELATARTSGGEGRTGLRIERKRRGGDASVSAHARHGTTAKISGRDAGQATGEKGVGYKKASQAGRSTHSAHQLREGDVAPQALPESCVGVVSTSKASTGDPGSIVVVWVLRESPRRWRQAGGSEAWKAAEWLEGSAGHGRRGEGGG
ncbi:hypothetical protein DFH06DRAFT_1127626 [Mycena polygramma]|nr:hypothetical protein DFH06DRAFT_1127626 [Mycena polygramma]